MSADDVRRAMPVLARGEGRWVGTYTHIDPDGTVQDSYTVHTNSSFPDDGSADFRLVTRNVWADGRETGGTYDARLQGDRLVWITGPLDGAMWEVDDDTCYLHFTYKADPSIRVFEMIQVSRDGRNRARTWHWFRDGTLFRVTLTDERRAEG